ncbi:MAG: hypothetical protein EON59_02485 [Alphaproteobacteria bacterium]|nr:MAG: hypothetical protein EON59_02485 [Alphaproteobacteria bacterium]
MGDRPTTRTAKPFARWCADTERAFLLALKLTGQVTKACAEIGRGTSAAYHRRDRDAEFAEAWDRAVADGQAEWAALSVERAGPADDGAGGGRLGRGHNRIDGWDKHRRGAFLRVLGRTKDVREACRAAGMSSTAAYALRGRSPPFARAWEKMLAVDVPSVLDAALERAVKGWVEPIVAGGKIVGERRRYSDTLLRALLLRDADKEKAVRKASAAALAKQPKSKQALEKLAHEAAEAAGGYFSHQYASREETNASLMKSLERLRQRNSEAQARAQQREWERWQACWGSRAKAAPLLLAGPQGDVAGVELLA